MVFLTCSLALPISFKLEQRHGVRPAWACSLGKDKTRTVFALIAKRKPNPFHGQGVLEGFVSVFLFFCYFYI